MTAEKILVAYATNAQAILVAYATIVKKMLVAYATTAPPKVARSGQERLWQ